MIETQKGDATNLRPIEMWVDSRGNFITELGGNDIDTFLQVTGGYGWYFGNLDDSNLYQILDKIISMASTKGRLSSLEMTILAPNDNDKEPKRTAFIRMDEDGRLHLHRQKVSAELEPATPEQRELLTNRFKSGAAILNPLPDSRAVEYFYKMDGTDIYIFVDAMKLENRYESFQMLMGEPGKVQPVEVDFVERYRDGGTTNILTSLGVLHSPAPEKKSEATWTTYSGEVAKLVPVGNKRASFENDPLLQILGIERTRFEQRAGVDICRFLLSRSQGK